MARTLTEVLERLPAKRRAKIEQRAAELATLQAIRQALQQTQKTVAKKLGVGQDTVSRMERSGESMQLSTLRRYVTAMGGQIEVLARFPNREPVVIYQTAGKRLAATKRQSPGREQRVATKRGRTRSASTVAAENAAKGSHSGSRLSTSK
jgi:transcriptional regulator with XRE-family HTH domain